MGAAALHRILAKLTNCVQPSPNQWQANCPIHKGGQEKDRSFGLSIDAEGRVKFNCLSGCGKEEIRAHFNEPWSELGPDANVPRLHDPNAAPADDKLPPEYYEAKCAEWAASFATDIRARAILAHDLGVPEAVFECIPLLGSHGDDPRGPCWTFPETDAHGRVIGVNLRFKGKDEKNRTKKSQMGGSNRGLTIPLGWESFPGPLYIVEGASDTLALIASRIAAVGRFNMTGGVALLAEFIKQYVPADREIIWLVENDSEDDKRKKSRLAARKLAADMERPLLSVSPPAGAKDAREWINRLILSGVQWEEIENRISLLWPTPKKVEPAIKQKESPNALVANDGRDQIDFKVGCDETVIGDAVITAIAKDPDLFVRAEAICRVIRAPISKNRGIKFPTAPQIAPVTPATLRERITSRVCFTGRRRGETVPISVPESVVHAVRDRKEWPKLRRLNAVVGFPFLRPDGTLVSESGYDEETGVYLNRMGAAPIIPKVLDLAAAQAAWEAINEAIKDFPFQKKYHRSAWLTGLLSPLARFTFDGPMPLFLIDGNTPGAGKSLLANVASLILTGQGLATMAYSHDDEEMRKKVTTIAMKGSPQMLLDNINGAFGGSTMDIVLTSTVWEDRLLGSNTNVTFPWFTQIWATGNNVQIHGDGMRRVNHTRLESKLERPEERTGFAHEDLKSWVIQRQPELLGHALTILMAYFKAGCPAQALIPWGSYEAWSAVVRSAVVWIGLQDPAKGKSQLRVSSDPIEAAMGVLLANWSKFDPAGDGITTNAIIAEVFPPRGGDTPTNLADVAEAITSMCTRATGQMLSIRFRQFRNRAVGKWKLIQVTTHANTIRWGADPVNDQFVSKIKKLEDGEDDDDTSSPQTQGEKTNYDNSLINPSKRSKGDTHHPHHPHQEGDEKPNLDGFPWDIKPK